MNRRILALLVLGAVCFSAFTTKPSKPAHQSKKFTAIWWDFNGGLADQGDPTYYSQDGDNVPDCPPALGNIYCEIKAQPNSSDPTVPNLTTITSSRYRPN